MADGNPLLAIHYASSNSIRIYQLLNGVFVQLSNGSGFQASQNTTAPAPTNNICWSNDGQRLYFVKHVTQSAQIMTAPVSLLNPITVFSSVFAPTNTAMQLSYAKDKNLISIIPPLGPDAYQARFVQISNDGQNANNSGVNVSTSNITGINLSSDAEWFIATRSTNAVLIGRRNGTTPTNVPTYSQTSFIVGYPTSKAVWSYDNSLVAIVDAAGTNVDIFKPVYAVGNVPDTYLEKIQTLPNLGVVKNIAFSGDGRTVAISYGTGGNYTTVLFKTYGEYIIQQEEQFTSFGASLEFTADGLHLVDAIQRDMFSFNGTEWTRQTAAMVNVIAGGSSAAMSPHIANALTQTKIYDGAVSKLVDDLSQLDMRMYLLNGTASFDKSVTNIDQIPANDINRNGNWPDFGLPLTFERIEGTGAVYLTSTETDHPVVTSFIQARYALIYDYNSKQPLMFYDLGANRIIPVGSKLTIEFTDDRILTYAP